VPTLISTREHVGICLARNGRPYYSGSVEPILGTSRTGRCEVFPGYVALSFEDVC
jgi:hypothetical protein